MSTIAALVGSGFEDVEYTKPVEAFRNAGHTITVVGKKAGEEVKGKHDTPVRVERAAGEVTPEEYDALFIPGGHSPDKLRIDEAVVEYNKVIELDPNGAFAKDAKRSLVHIEKSREIT